MKTEFPRYNLNSIKHAFVSVEDLVMSSKARRDLASFGISLENLVVIIQDIESSDFVESIPASFENKAWQDVYNVAHKDLVLKFQRVDGTNPERFIICT